MSEIAVSAAARRRAVSRGMLRMSGLAAGVGLAAGGAAYVLVHAIAMLTNLAFFHRTGWELPSFRDLEIGPMTYVVAVSGALVVSLLALWAPVIRGHGIPEAIDAILNKQSRIAPRTAIAKPVSAVAAIGTGGPFGAEGPIIVTGGAIGSLLGQLMHVTPNERKILLASGAAAGMAATFGAPLAAVIIAIELLLFEFSMRAFIPLVAATSVAAGVHSALFGSGPLFTVPPHDFSGLGQLPLFAVLGLLCGLLAALVSKGLFVEHLYRRLPVGQFWHPMIGAVLFVSIALLEPRALGVGYDAIDDALAGRLALGALSLLGAVKLVVWWVALGSGTSGGTLAPVLMIGACFGGVFGELVHRIAPQSHITAGTCALVAMAATFGAATRATFASIVFLFELTRDYDSILPLMLATVLATMVTAAVMQDSLLTEKLSRRGVKVPADYHVDVLSTTTVAEVMTPVPGSATEDRHDGWATIDPTAPLIAALERLSDDQLDELYVVDDAGAVVGVVATNDVLSARVRRLHLDRRQPGWLTGR